LQPAIVGSLETDTHPRVARDERLTQGFDVRAGELHPSVALAELIDRIGVTGVKERLPMFFHEGEEEIGGFPPLAEVRWQLVIS